MRIMLICEPGQNLTLPDCNHQRCILLECGRREPRSSYAARIGAYPGWPVDYQFLPGARLLGVEHARVELVEIQRREQSSAMRLPAKLQGMIATV